MGQRGAVDHYGDHGLTTPVYADDQIGGTARCGFPPGRGEPSEGVLHRSSEMRAKYHRREAWRWGSP